MARKKLTKFQQQIYNDLLQEAYRIPDPFEVLMNNLRLLSEYELYLHPGDGTWLIEPGDIFVIRKRGT